MAERTAEAALGTHSLALSSSFLPMTSIATIPATPTIQKTVMPAKAVPSAVAAAFAARASFAAPLTAPAAWSAPCAPRFDPSHPLLAAPNHSDQLFLVLAGLPGLFNSRGLRGVRSHK